MTSDREKIFNIPPRGIRFTKDSFEAILAELDKETNIPLNKSCHRCDLLAQIKNPHNIRGENVPVEWLELEKRVTQDVSMGNTILVCPECHTFYYYHYDYVQSDTVSGEREMLLKIPKENLQNEVRKRFGSYQWRGIQKIDHGWLFSFTRPRSDDED